MLFCDLDFFHLCPMRRPVAVFATPDDLLAGVCRQIGDHEPKRKPRQSARRFKRTFFSADTQARRVRNSSKCTPGDNNYIQRLCPTGRGPDEENFIDKIHTGTRESSREPPGLIPWSKGCIGRQGLCQQGPLRGPSAVTGSCERLPVIDPCGPGEQRGGRLICKRRLRD